MTDLNGVVKAALVNAYINLTRNELDALARNIVRAVLEHLHETGALSVPPSDFPMTDPKNATP